MSPERPAWFLWAYMYLAHAAAMRLKRNDGEKEKLGAVDYEGGGILA